MSTGRKCMAVIGLAAVAVLLQGGWASAAIVTWTDNFDSYPTGQLNGNDGWTDSGGNNYQIVAGAGVAGTQGVNKGGGSQQMNWTGHPWDWATLAVGDKVIARMDFQANGSGQFDDDRVGWVLASNPGSSSYHFAVQLDNTDNTAPGGLGTYFRDNSGNRVMNAKLIPWATLGSSGSNWYREEMQVTKLTSGLGAGGAKVDVSFWALDASGNVVPGSLKTASYGPFDNSGLRGFSGTVYPMFKNYSAVDGYADNAFFQITPEPATLSLLAIGGLLVLRRRHR
ncbi:MAG: PEP-CTERM sorting domain-containing protein [Planctomycetota bacterium]|nr:PEP-CTERM sorting domain-containing protein [Planctomycetota bacterium]